MCVLIRFIRRRADAPDPRPCGVQVVVAYFPLVGQARVKNQEDDEVKEVCTNSFHTKACRRASPPPLRGAGCRSILSTRKTGTCQE